MIEITDISYLRLNLTYVEFKDVGAVNSNEINYYYTRTFSQYEVMTERIFTNDKGNYILSRTSMDKKAIDKNGTITYTTNPT